MKQVHRIAEEGMKFSSPKAIDGGPTIMDINTGYVRDPYGLNNMYTSESGPPDLAVSDFNLYRNIVERIRRRVMTEFNLDRLYFTAPTFVTREVGTLENGWVPMSPHDEYWHPHVDKNNTEHYDFSGLLYLSDYGVDFTGGMFAFLDGFKDYEQPRPCYDEDIERMGAPRSCASFALDGECDLLDGAIAEACPLSCRLCTPRDTFTVEQDDRSWKEMTSGDGRTAREIAPARGRLVMFASGPENLHLVRQVRTGKRFVMSLWFTLDDEKHFETFLDGKAHVSWDEAARGREPEL